MESLSLTRLQRFLKCESYLSFRITPAYAGITTSKRRQVPKRKDHPRLRGYYILLIVEIKILIGSPPLTRVLRSFGEEVYKIGGITPAYAGTTKLEGKSFRRQRDHPRLRGYYFTMIAICKLGSGSPPLTRVLQFKRILTFLFNRITPAYAGTTVNISLF